MSERDWAAELADMDAERERELLARAERAEKLLEEAARLLKEIEWQGCDRDAMPQCPVCRSDQHDVECELVAWLTRYRALAGEKP